MSDTRTPAVAFAANSTDDTQGSIPTQTGRLPPAGRP